ncbi:hypothetical protein B0H63DRAFT_518922 [Podospora didyma]|uniref:CFEM domain-containing protein n=1 Tax=Podospora didyma TaxID=330526 RepID=A0AAE0NYD4_9PEZI|nr:hypothetical protein B0H63DRAFT_518922 [Podospora didyma]
MQSAISCSLFLSLFAVLFVLTPSLLAAEVDFKGLPKCAWSDCFPFHSSAIGCGSLSKECFCDALAPVNCAGQNCTGAEWYEVEDWFNGQCGSPQNVTLQQLPQCSRSCIRQAIMPQFCQTQITRNCFCRLQDFFQGLTRCLVDGCDSTLAAANETLHDFYRETCIYSPSVDGNGAPGTGGAVADEVVPAPKDGDSSSSGGPVERLGLIIGLVTGFATIAGILISLIVWYAKHKRNAGEDTIFIKMVPEKVLDFLDPPPAYDK